MFTDPDEIYKNPHPGLYIPKLVVDYTLAAVYFADPSVHKAAIRWHNCGHYMDPDSKDEAMTYVHYLWQHVLPTRDHNFGWMVRDFLGKGE